MILAVCLLLALGGAAHAQPPDRTVIFVDKDAAAGGDGRAWATAYNTVQAALDVTNADGATDYEIWVAEGAYYPDEGGSHVANSQAESFRINYDNVQLYGGFAGTETAREQRDWTAHPTILSGDIDGNDTNSDGNAIAESYTDIQGSNAYHVVYLDGVNNENITTVTVLDGFTVTGGNADMYGGGLYCAGNGSSPASGHVCSPTLANVTLTGNNASLLGGGMYNEGQFGESSPVLINVTISGNHAMAGGGMHNNGNTGKSSPLLTNVTISGNSAGVAAGMYNIGQNNGESSPVLTDVTISGNSASGGPGGGMYNDGIGGVSSPVLTNVTISGNSAPYGGGGMFNRGLGGVSSPVLTNVTISGNSGGGNGGGMYNIGTIGESSPVLLNSIVWGNTASTGAQIYNDSATPGVSYSDVQGGYAGAGNIDADPLFVAPVAASSAPTTMGDYRLPPRSPAVDTGTNSGCPATDLDGQLRPANAKDDGAAICDMGAYEVHPYLFYVDKDAPGPLHDGLAWATAYTTVQEALDAVKAGGARYEIWVAEGTYYPDEGGSHVDNSRGESFRIRYDNVQIYGGFAGTETLRTERNWTAHPTVLSGDSDGDSTLAGNAYHVVYLDGATHENITTATVLDGFTITGGNADGGASPNNNGGGLYCAGNGSSPASGHACSPALANVTLSGNSASALGGGMYNDGQNGESNPVLKSVTISGNSASSGGGMYNDGFGGVSNPVLTDVTISGNQATNHGGGIYNGGLRGASSPLLTNVTISDNSANIGGGMFNNSYDGVSSPVLLNSIVWGNVANTRPQLADYYATPSVSYSDVQGGGYAGVGNLDADPLFAAPIDVSSAPTTTGDYRLLPGSPAIDSGTNTDAPATDRRGLPRPVGLSTDMGAYEAQGFSLAISGGDGQTATAGGAFSQPLAVQISSATGEPVGPGGVLTFTPPSTGAGVTVTIPFTAASDGSGLVTTAVTANGSAGSYGVAATVRGAGGQVDFSLANTLPAVAVTLSGTGSGSVTSTPAGIACGATCTASFDYNTQVTLAATPDTGSTFTGWSGACSGNGACAVTMTANKVVTATFTRNQYMAAASADPAAGGTVSGGGMVSHGDTVTVVATANSGYTFAHWTEEGKVVSTDASYSFTATGDRALVAHFTRNQYTIAASADPAAGGTVSGGGTVNYGDEVTLTATANAGYTFINWTEGGTQVSTDVSYSFLAAGSRALVAHFTRNQYTVAASADPAAGGSVSGGGAVNYGQQVTVVATANAGYTFVNWTEGGTQVSTSASYSFPAAGNRTLVAHFTQLSRPLAVNDAAGALEGGAVDVPVLANDLDPAGGGLTVIAVTQPAHGAASITGDNVRYAPTSGFSGEDSFTYTVEDANGLTSTGMVVIAIAPLTQAEEAPQVMVVNPSVQNSLAFSSSQASVAADLPAGFYTGTVGAADTFFLAYTPVVTPTLHTQTPPDTLRFGNFEFQLAVYRNAEALHNIVFAQPITLTIRYDAALLSGLDPQTLQLRFWDGAGWSSDGITVVSHDSANGTLTVALSHFSEFAFFATPQTEPEASFHLYLPTVNN